MKLTQEELKRWVSYDPDSGAFTRIVSARGRQRVGSLHSSGYVYIRVAGVRYRAHRLAFLYMEGHMPLMVDHINGDRADNRWSNLRPTDPRGNSENRRNPQGRNKYLGTYWVTAKKKWAACICINKVRTHIGYFNTAEEARDAYLERKRTAHSINPV